jgi:flagellar basal-body rod modification protein FlgD
MASEMKLLMQSIGMASGLIGKMVSWTGVDSTGYEVTKEGQVTAISFKDGKQYASVNDESISLDQLLKIWDAETTS